MSRLDIEQASSLDMNVQLAHFGISLWAEVRSAHIFSTETPKAAVSIRPLCRGIFIIYKRLGSNCHDVVHFSMQPALLCRSKLGSWCSTNRRAVQLLYVLPGHKLLALVHGPDHISLFEENHRAAAHNLAPAPVNIPRFFDTVTSSWW